MGGKKRGEDGDGEKEWERKEKVGKGEGSRGVY